MAKLIKARSFEFQDEEEKQQALEASRKMKEKLYSISFSQVDEGESFDGFE